MGTPPGMEYFAEPELTGTTHQTARFSMSGEMGLQVNPTLETLPLTNADPYVPGAGSGGAGGAGGGGGAAGTTAGAGGSSGGGGAGGTNSASDNTGSFGPKQGYGIPAEGFVVDMTDCRDAPAALRPGMEANEESGSELPKPQYCVLTGRGRLEPVGGGTGEVVWTVQAGGVKTFRQKTFSSAHDARATIIIPPTPP